MTTPARSLLLVLLFSLLVSGCFGSAPPVPRDHFYRLALRGPTAANVRGVLPGTLVIEPLEADGLLHERALLYSENGRALQVQQHDYHYWADSPPRMLQDQIVDYLRRSGFSRAIVTPEMRVEPDYRLTGKAERLERLIGKGPPRVAVALELTLVRLRDSRLVLSDRFSEEGRAADGSVEASVVAMNDAVASILDRFLASAAGNVTSMAQNPPGHDRASAVR